MKTVFDDSRHYFYLNLQLWWVGITDKYSYPPTVAKLYDILKTEIINMQELELFFIVFSPF